MTGTNGAGCQGPGAPPSNTLTLIVNSATVNTTTNAANAAATYGDASVTLNATVSPATNVGTVQFTIKNGPTTVGSVSSPNVTAGAASATFPLSGVNAGTYTIEATYTGGTGFNASNNATQIPQPTLTVNKATTTTVVTFEAGPYTYRGSAFTATAQVTGAGGLAEGVPVIYTGDCLNVTAASGCTATATYVATTNYAESTDSKSITITPASTTTVVTFEAGPYTYRGSAFTATAEVTGAGSLVENVSVIYTGDCVNVTSANGCTATATYVATTNYAESTDSNSITITPATTTTVVTFEAGPYTYRGSAFTATAQVTGAGSLVGNVSVTYTGDCVNVTSANGCTATATYVATTNYAGSTDSKSITITPASTTTVVAFEAGPYTYRGSAFTATAQVTGANGLVENVSVTYTGDCVNVTSANGCTATATYVATTNYAGSTDSKSITITPASTTTVVTFEAGPYTYRGSAFTATAQVTGANGLAQGVSVILHR